MIQKNFIKKCFFRTDINMKNKGYKTFKFKGLTFKIHPEVYDPAEDTFQLIESVKIKKDDKMLDIGCGCGIIGLACAKKGANVVCTDINPFAIENTKENYNYNKNLIKGYFEVRKGDLFSPISENEIFDIIVFNPPYLPSLKEDIIDDKWFNTAVDGGKTGLEVTKKFILNVQKYLTPTGFVYFVFSSLANKEYLFDILSKTSFRYDILNSISYNNEKIEIFRLKNL